MVILRTRNKITDFLMILAWASPFNVKISSNSLAYYRPIFTFSSSMGDNYFQFMNCVGLSIALPLFSPLGGTTPDGRAVAEVGEERGAACCRSCCSPVTSGYGGCAPVIDPMLL